MEIFSGYINYCVLKGINDYNKEFNNRLNEFKKKLKELQKQLTTKKMAKNIQKDIETLFDYLNSYKYHEHFQEVDKCVKIFEDCSQASKTMQSLGLGSIEDYINETKKAYNEFITYIRIRKNSYQK